MPDRPLTDKPQPSPPNIVRSALPRTRNGDTGPSCEAL
ncbi:hypothetical protein GFS60_02022 [Rhodococcus sp. WAY2]|nr:hypothetical protein GFS60_02022 [Rhodococcus sp. WAY2]